MYLIYALSYYSFIHQDLGKENGKYVIEILQVLLFWSGLSVLFLWKIPQFFTRSLASKKKFVYVVIENIVGCSSSFKHEMLAFFYHHLEKINFAAVLQRLGWLPNWLVAGPHVAFEAENGPCRIVPRTRTVFEFRAHIARIRGSKSCSFGSWSIRWKLSGDLK